MAVTGRDYAAGVEGGGSSLWYTDTFTGSDGAAWDAAWSVGQAATTGTGSTLSGNMGLLSGGTTGSYSDNDVISRHVGKPPADAEILTTFKVGSTESYPALVLRSYNDSSLYYSNGYFLQLYKGGTVNLKRSYVGTTSTLTSAAFTITAGTLYKARFRVEGNVISVRLWAAAGSEPGSWLIQYTDTTNSIRGGGYAGVLVMGGSTAGQAPQVSLDDFSLTALGATPYPLIELSPAADTGSATENEIVDTSGGVLPVSSADTGQLTDLITSKAMTGVADTGHGVEAGSSGSPIAVTDAGASADAVSALVGTFTARDTGAFSEGATIVGLVTVVSSSDTGHGGDAVLQVPAAVPGSDTGSSSEAEPEVFKLVPIGNEETALAVEQALADADLATDERGLAAEAALIIKLAFHFTPPTVRIRYPWKGRLTLAVDRGVTVLKRDGFYRQLSDPTNEDVEASDVVYPGGRSYPISEEERQALIDAGYGSFVALLPIH